MSNDFYKESGETLEEMKKKNPNTYQIKYASHGSYFNDSCYSNKMWQRKKADCVNIGIENFMNSKKNAYIALFPYGEYFAFRNGSIIELDPNELNCVENEKAYNCSLKSKRAIKMIDAK